MAQLGWCKQQLASAALSRAMLDLTHMTMCAGTAQHGTAQRYVTVFNELQRKWKMAWSDKETLNLLRYGAMRQFKNS